METIILFAPLLGALLCGFGWRIMGEYVAQWVATFLLFIACILSWIIFFGFDPFAHENGTYTVQVLRWIESRSARHRLGHPDGPADGDHAGGDHHGFGARAPLFLWLHGP